jgi:hypothetical protein
VSLRIIGLAALLLAGLTAAAAEQGSADARARAIADYPTGDSCLFCHRNDIGSTWLDNSHAWTIRPAGEPPAVRPIPAMASSLYSISRAVRGRRTSSRSNAWVVMRLQ